MDVGMLVQLLASAQGEQEAGKLTAEQKKLLQSYFDKVSHPENFPQLHSQALPESEAGAVTTDPALRAAQMNALSKMREIEDNGGLTLADMAAQKKTTDMSNRAAGAMHGKVLESMARRGMGGSGAELVANLQANQDAAERANEAGMQTQAMAQKRYYDSIMGRGQMAGNLRNQDFDQNMRTAQARDIRNKYNNDQAYDAQRYNADLPVRLLGMEGQASGALGNFYDKGAQQTRDYWSGMGVAGREALKDGGNQQSQGYPQGYDPNDDRWRYRNGNYDIRDPGDK